MQLFHCHQHTGGEGGETLLVDGIGAAYKLKECDPESFEFLCSTALPAQYYVSFVITVYIVFPVVVRETTIILYSVFTLSANSLSK